MESKKTIILGASENPGRYSYLALKRLQANGHDIIAIGKKAGNVDGTPIITGQPEITGANTVTLYLNPANQRPYYDYILKIKPQRVIFNPGTENTELEELLAENGIKPVEACTLVLLSTGQY